MKNIFTHTFDKQASEQRILHDAMILGLSPHSYANIVKSGKLGAMVRKKGMDLVEDLKDMRASGRCHGNHDVVLMCAAMLFLQARDTWRLNEAINDICRTPSDLFKLMNLTGMFFLTRVGLS